ncbi:hypothetical protein Xen7305DRAFT_00052830 [Xenococcus sp. PCC 7305]|uniref:hypothetical protein n=1 Tax=Xenococcus sp. PCC 7305 TaxID=102125 RepID=UPI0002AC94EB|nr:hypothetical protein [Xenococcus sp. PCC 7305]ELS05537.1 hypothetical protein Xen7305DRAFT_00052830 [Xenococcus sp. PCC 7305]
MEECIKRFLEEHKSINIEKNYQLIKHLEKDGEWKEEEYTIYILENIEGLSDFQLVLRDEEDFASLTRILKSQPTLFDDFLAVSCNNHIEVHLNNIGRFASFRLGKRKEPIIININYNHNKLDVSIKHVETKETTIGFLASLMKGIRLTKRSSTVLIIEGLDRPSSEGVESDVRNIINSVLFDIECSYGLTFETANIESYKRLRFRRRSDYEPLPEEPIQLLYKRYIPELIEYFHIAQKVDYLPFKYICYFHIVEYFMDKAAYNLVSRKIKNLLSNPDFHIKSNEYILQAINIFKKENEKYTTDKIKVGRVLREYVDMKSILEHIKSLSLKEHFDNEHELQCAKTLNICAINFTNENNFYDTLTKRIYALRCSIVHSNPDFDESKAVPFTPTPENMNFLRYEIEMLKEISRKIIVNSIA